MDLSRLQIHDGGGIKVRWKDIQIKELQLTSVCVRFNDCLLLTA
jgi:hypothetical protein